MKYKTIPIKNLQVKKVDGSNVATFDGYGSVFGGPPDSYGDVVDSGAFTRTINSWNEKIKGGQLLPMLWQHQYDNPIGGYGNVIEDAKGLALKEASINLDVQKGAECYSLMKQGSICALSIGYSVMQEKACDECPDSDEPHNHLIEVKLYEISPVTFPAKDTALITAVKSRQAISEIDAVVEFLQKLRNGLSNPELFHVELADSAKPLDEKDLSEFLDEIRKLRKSNEEVI